MKKLLFALFLALPLCASANPNVTFAGVGKAVDAAGLVAENSSGNATVALKATALGALNVSLGNSTVAISGNNTTSPVSVVASTPLTIAGNNTDSPVLVSGYAGRPSASITNPSGNFTYSSGTIFANSSNASLVTPLQWTVGRVAGGSGMIRKVRVRSNSTSITNASYRIHFYRTPMTFANGNNGTWSTNNSTAYMGAADVTMTTAFTDGSAGNGVPNVGSEINFVLPAGQSLIYGNVEVRGARASSGNETLTIDLETLQN